MKQPVCPKPDCRTVRREHRDLSAKYYQQHDQLEKKADALLDAYEAVATAAATAAGFRQGLPSYSNYAAIEAFSKGLIDAAIDKAIEQFGNEYPSTRGTCPLCSADPSFAHKYTIPEGLSRHLEGTYSARQCDVMAALRAWRILRHEHEEEEQTRKEQESQEHAH